MNAIPLILNEATIALYPCASNGTSRTGDSIWAGACVENARIAKMFRTHDIWATGAKYPEHRHEGKYYDISIGRLWFLPTGTKEDFDPIENDQYVMVITWQDERTGIWHRKTFYGTMIDSLESSSRGIMEFAQDQKFQAWGCLNESGSGVVTQVNSPACLDAMQLFVKDDYLANGDYLLGHYAWSTPVTVTSAKIVCRKPVGTNLVLTLEVDGNLTDSIITVPMGTVGSWSGLVNQALSEVVDAGKTVRWIATTAPASSGNQPYDIGLVMTVA